MTPLAQRVLSDSTLPMKHRRFRMGSAPPGILKQNASLDSLIDVPKKLLSSVPFEVTQVLSLAFELRSKIYGSVDGSVSEGGLKIKEDKLAFLPAPVTWIEYSDDPEKGMRTGFLLEAHEDAGVARMTMVFGFENGPMLNVAHGPIFLRENKEFGVLWKPIFIADLSSFEAVRNNISQAEEDACDRMMDIYPLLAMINSPRVIGRRQHMPHAGLQKRLASSMRMPGKYPLQAWHEIRLEVSPPKYLEGDHEAMLTGGASTSFLPRASPY